MGNTAMPGKPTAKARPARDRIEKPGFTKGSVISDLPVIVSHPVVE
jgi:hypothetical protein